MGEDLIYQFKKMLPRTLVAIVGAVLCVTIFFIAFSHFVTSWGLVMIILIFGSAIAFTVFEYYRSIRLVKGDVGNIPISDLTKAIYWLSAVNTERVSFPLGGIHYCRNVGKVAQKIGGEVYEKWQSVLERHRIPSARSLWLAVILSLSMMVAMLITIDVFRDIQFWVIGLMLVGVFGILFATSHQLKAVRVLSQDPQVKEVTGFLIQEFVSWISGKTTQPVRVVLAGGSFIGAESVDSLYGHVIAEIKPQGSTPQTIKERQSPVSEIPEIERISQIKKSQSREQALYLSIHLLAGLAIGFLVFIGLEAVFAGRSNPFIMIVVAMSVVMFAATQYFLYTYLPIMKVIFKGGKANPHDLQMILKRSSRGMVESLCRSDQDFKQKTTFLISLHKKKLTEFSGLEESIKLWLMEDTRQPEGFRYFKIEANTVTLMPKGEALAKAVEQKMPDEAESRLRRLLLGG